MLVKEGFITETKKRFKIRACSDGLKSATETVALGQYLEEVLPNNPENSFSWDIFSGLSQLTTNYIKSCITTEQKTQTFFSIAERYVQYLINSGQYLQALQIIRLVTKMIQSLPDKQYQKAIFTAFKADIFRTKGKNSTAEKLLRTAIRQFEKDATRFQIPLAQLYAVLGLVLLYDDKQRFSEAEKVLQKALVIRQINLGEKHILTITSHLHIAEFYVQMGMTVKAIECLKSTKEYLAPFNNKFYEAWVNDIMGLASYFSHKERDAITLCEKSLLARRQFLPKHHPLLLESLHNVGHLLLLAGKPTEAIEYLNYLTRLAGTYKEMFWVKKELSEMLYAELRQKIETNTITENILNVYGVQFKNSFNDYKRAEECYLLNIKLNPNSSNTCSNYALLLTSIKKEDDAAEELYLKSIKLDPLNSVAMGNYAFFLQNVRKKFTQSEICYQEALELDNKDRSNLANYASLKLIQGDIDEAKKLASKSLKLCISDPNRFMARVLFLFIVIRMFECKNYDDLLAKMKFLFNYGMEHVTWDNRELMVFIKKILRVEECDFLQKFFDTINDYSCIVKLNNSKEWKDIEPVPFVTAYQPAME